MTPAQLAAIKAGDYVWVGNSSHPHTTLKIVERITPAQIVTPRRREGTKH